MLKLRKMDNEPMKNLDKIRDELAKSYALTKFPVQNIETTKDYTQDVNFSRRMSHCQSFQDGFDAAVNELEPMINELVDALEQMVGHTVAHLQFPHKDTSSVTIAIITARETLEKYNEKKG